MTRATLSWLAELAGPFEAGTVVLAGAGPGDPGLISLKAAARLTQCDVVVYDQLANPELLNLASDTAERIYVGKKAGLHSIPQDRLNQRLVELARAGRRVVRLKGGDPFVFGRGGEECEALADAGVPFEVVPGITAAVAAPAYAGIPVTHRDWTATFVLVTGHEDPTKAESNIDFAALARIGTIAFYMGVKNLAANCRRLMDAGLPSDTPAALIRNGTRGDQRTIIGTVADIAERAAAAGFTPPAMTLIGRVVGLRDRLNWFESRPLFGHTIIVTRTRHQASALSTRLRALGAVVLEAPTIDLAPPGDLRRLDQAIRQIGTYDWLVLTSVNGVDAMTERMRAAGLDARSLGGVRLAAIGSATAERLNEHFLVPEVVPEQFVAESLAAELGRFDLRQKRVLLLRADIARPALREALAQCGAVCDDVPIYRTIRPAGLPPEVVETLEAGGADWITFTSSSTFANFVEMFGGDRLRALCAPGGRLRLASIGPITSATIRDAGFVPTVEATEHTIRGLVRAIQEARP